MNEIYDEILQMDEEMKQPVVDNLHCLSLIQGGAGLSGLDLDYSEVRILSFSCINPEDESLCAWKYELFTKMYGPIGKTGRDVYRVKWTFEDKWGNPAFYKLNGPMSSGALEMTPIDYGDFETIIFRIRNGDKVAFEFNQADGICVSDAQPAGHETLAEIYPEDYLDGDLLFDDESSESGEGE